VHKAYGAADTPPWDAAALAAMAPERHTAIRFRRTPGLALVAAAHPVARIWTIPQAS